MNSRARKDLFESCESYFKYFCENNSCHAGNWFIKVESPRWRTFLLFILFLIKGFLCAVVCQTLFFKDLEISQNCRTIIPDKTGNSLTDELPFITVCNPRLFDKNKLEGIS